MKKNSTKLVFTLITLFFISFNIFSSEVIEKKVDSLVKKANYLSQKGELDSVIQIRQLAFILCYQNELYDKSIVMLQNISRGYNYKKEFYEGLRVLYFASNLAENKKIENKKVDINFDFLHLYVNLNDFEKANKIIDDFIENKNFHTTKNLAIAFVEKATIFQKTNNLDSAFYYFRKGIEYSKEAKDFPSLFVGSLRLSLILIEHNDYERAQEIIYNLETFAQDSIYPSTDLGNYFDFNATKIKLLIGTNHIVEASSLLKKLQSQKKQINPLHYPEMHYLKHAMACAKKEKTLLNSLNNFINMYDSTNVEINLVNKQQYRAFLQVDENREKIKLKEQKIKSEERKKKLSFILNLFALVVIVILIFLIIIIRKNRKLAIQLKKNEELRLKQELQGQKYYLLQLSKIIEDRNTVYEKITKNINKIVGENKNNDELIKQLNIVLSRIHLSKTQNKELNSLSQIIDKVTPSFVIKLRELHPTITKQEEKICVLLNEGVSIRELAHILGISSRTVQKIKTQLKQKFNIEQNKTLIDYFKQVQE